MSGWYDRQGNPLTNAALRALPPDYKRVANHDGDTFQVSTVWLGLDHSYDGGPPLIFESMVFGHRHPLDQVQRRYSTEAEALAGHKTLVAECEHGERVFAIALDAASSALPELLKQVFYDVLTDAEVVE